ncbi:MAG: hypothetical protein QOE57_1919 [Acidimicrobiaceae bacterium]|nr:hypothetical protein [Acidimicrobiaceae bacterium]
MPRRAARARPGGRGRLIRGEMSVTRSRRQPRARPHRLVSQRLGLAAIRRPANRNRPAPLGRRRVGRPGHRRGGPSWVHLAGGGPRSRPVFRPRPAVRPIPQSASPVGVAALRRGPAVPCARRPVVVVVRRRGGGGPCARLVAVGVRRGGRGGPCARRLLAVVRHVRAAFPAGPPVPGVGGRLRRAEQRAQRPVKAVVARAARARALRERPGPQGAGISPVT